MNKTSLKIIILSLLLSGGMIMVNGCGRMKEMSRTNNHGMEDIEAGNKSLRKDSLPDDVAKNYKLIWQDEFDGNELVRTRWGYRADGATRKLGVVTRDNVSLDGEGNLVIKVTEKDGKYYIGQIGTKGKFEAKYGYFECRAKMNLQPGPHVAFWLQSSEYGKLIGDPAGSGAEIDIFEYHRKTPATVYHNLHWDGYGDDHKHEGKKVAIPDVGQGFHVFGLRWTPTEYAFYVDGEETWKTSTAVSETEEYIILSAELTGWGGDPATATYPDSVVYDYVRVYQKR